MAEVYIDSILTITDAVQGVTQWLVERKVNAGPYVIFEVPAEYNGDEFGLYLCPSSPSGELEVYSFAYQEMLSSEDFSVDDVLQWRFTPAGFDSGNGDAFESAEYTVTELIPQSISMGQLLGMAI